MDTKAKLTDALSVLASIYPDGIDLPEAFREKFADPATIDDVLNTLTGMTAVCTMLLDRRETETGVSPADQIAALQAGVESEEF